MTWIMVKALPEATLKDIKALNEVFLSAVMTDEEDDEDLEEDEEDEGSNPLFTSR